MSVVLRLQKLLVYTTMKESMKMITIHDIGCKVKTPYGVGILVDVNPGGGYWVRPLNPDEEWEDNDFDGRQLERVRIEKMKEFRNKLILDLYDLNVRSDITIE